MDVCLIVPGSLATASAAHHYYRRMADGLRALGHGVRIVELDGRLPDADQTTINAAHSAWAALPGDSVKLIDARALPAFAGLPLNDVTALIHHPASLETGLPRDTAPTPYGTTGGIFATLPRLVVTSDQTMEYVVRALAVPADHVSVIGPGIDDLPRSPGSAGAACQILSVGALIPRKGHDILLRALSRLLDLDWELTMAGTADRDPVHAAGLRALAEDLNIARRVRFAREATDTLWAGADLFALTSYAEDHGTAIAEALGRGLPVAVSNVGAVCTMVGPEAGVVCAPGDIEQLSKAMRRLIFDRPLLRDMAEVAWQAGQSLPSWNEQAGRLAAILAGS